MTSRPRSLILARTGRSVCLYSLGRDEVEVRLPQRTLSLDADGLFALLKAVSSPRWHGWAREERDGPAPTPVEWRLLGELIPAACASLVALLAGSALDAQARTEVPASPSWAQREVRRGLRS